MHTLPLITSLSITLCLLLTGCGASDKESSASKHYKEKIAIEEQRILSTTQLIENAQRNPTETTNLENTFNDYMPIDQALLNNDDCRLVAARTFAYSYLVKAIARNASIIAELELLFSNNAGTLSVELIKPCEQARYQRNFVVARLIEAQARLGDSEDFALVKAAVKTMIGDYQAIEWNNQPPSELEIAGALQAQASMFNSLGRSPSLEFEEQKFSAINAEFLPAKASYLKANGCLANQARLFALNAYLQSMARNPKVFDCANDNEAACPKTYIGKISDNQDAGGCALPNRYPQVF